MKLDTITNKAEKQGSELNPNDEYYTPNYAIEPLIKFIKSNSTIWCPFDTHNSNYVKLFSSKGHNVIHTHIEEGKCFFKTACPDNVDYIISNPPYSMKTEVFQHLFHLNKPFAMLVGVVGLFESQKRFTMFKDNDFEIMYFDKRISYFKNYDDQKPKLNPPFSSVYLCKGLLPKQIVFETLSKK